MTCVPLRDDQFLEYACCFGLHAGEDMLIGVDGERWVPVPKSFAHHLDRDTALAEFAEIAASLQGETE